MLGSFTERGLACSLVRIVGRERQDDRAVDVRAVYVSLQLVFAVHRAIPRHEAAFSREYTLFQGNSHTHTTNSEEKRNKQIRKNERKKTVDYVHRLRTRLAFGRGKRTSSRRDDVHTHTLSGAVGGFGSRVHHGGVAAVESEARRVPTSYVYIIPGDERIFLLWRKNAYAARSHQRSKARVHLCVPS